MKFMRVFPISFLLFAIMGMCVPASAQSRIDEPPSCEARDTWQECICWTGQEDPFALSEITINRVIAKLKAVSTDGHPYMAGTWENLKNKLIAEQETLRNMVRFIVKVQSEQPGLNIGLRQDPRLLLPPAYIPEWDALVKKRDEAHLQAVRSTRAHDAAWEKHMKR